MLTYGRNASHAVRQEVKAALAAAKMVYAVAADPAGDDPALADPDLHPDVFRVRVARPRTVGEDAGVLVQRRYESRGYQAASTVTDPSLYTFAAYDSGTLVGTLGVRLDSPAGLKIEELYGDEVEALSGLAGGETVLVGLAVAPADGAPVEEERP